MILLTLFIYHIIFIEIKKKIDNKDEQSKITIMKKEYAYLANIVLNPYINKQSYCYNNYLIFNYYL